MTNNLMKETKHNSNKDKKESPKNQDDPRDNYDETWDEWYDDIDFFNKNHKIKKSTKRSYKNRDEW